MLAEAPAGWRGANVPVFDGGGAGVRGDWWNDEESDDAHWRVISDYTSMNSEYRRQRRADAHLRWRFRVGLALVRLGLVVAPLTVADITGECQADAS